MTTVEMIERVGLLVSVAVARKASVARAFPADEFVRDWDWDLMASRAGRRRRRERQVVVDHV